MNGLLAPQAVARVTAVTSTETYIDLPHFPLAQKGDLFRFEFIAYSRTTNDTARYEAARLMHGSIIRDGEIKTRHLLPLTGAEYELIPFEEWSEAYEKYVKIALAKGTYA